MFPHRDGDKHTEEKNYSWNDVNQVTRAAIINLLVDIGYEFEPDKKTN